MDCIQPQNVTDWPYLPSEGILSYTWLPIITSNCTKTPTSSQPTILNFKLHHYYPGWGWSWGIVGQHIEPLLAPEAPPQNSTSFAGIIRIFASIVH